MNQLKLTILFLFFFISGIAQNLEFNIHNKKLVDFIKIEKKTGGEIFESKSNHISGKDVAQPIIYMHKERNLPYLFTYYFFYKSDSTISYILHEWDNTNIVGYDDITIMPDKQIKALINKYNTLTSYIDKLYGPSKSTGSLDGLADIATKSIQKKDIWQPNDSTEIELYTVLSSKNVKKGMISVNPTYRIRLYIKNTKTKNGTLAMANPDKETIALMDSTALAFFANLAEGDYNKAKLHISDLIIKTVTNQKLESMAGNIKFDEGFSIYMTGVQSMLDGESYAMIQYKYTTDTESPPKVLIKLMFDTNYKIVGIKPTQRY
jgi:hypothetical protein